MISRVKKRLLLLGGTGEAIALAEQVEKYFSSDLEIITSLAGRTQDPISPPGMVRRGGFGGPDGLVSFLREEEIGVLIDATHPFAAQISRHARLAAETLKLPRLVLTRPPWPQHPQDTWISVSDVQAAAAAVAVFAEKESPSRLKVFLTIGSQEIEPFLALSKAEFLLRQIAPVKKPLPANMQVILGRGPFIFETELDILTRHEVKILVAKASGGAATYPKIAAARQLKIPVIMIARPEVEAGETVTEVAAALKWLSEKLAVETV